MNQADKVFAGGVPDIYQRHMVPMIFGPYALDMADRVARLKPKTLLEIGAGTGVLTRAMAERLGGDTEIVATDLNQPMLDVAASLPFKHGQVAFRQADAMDLPFKADSFDMVVCQFGVMFFPDKQRSYREVKRVLRPAGVYVFSVWDKLSSNAFVEVVSNALAHRFPQDPPCFMERTPHGYSDTEIIVSELRDAGFSDVRVETVEKLARSESAASAATGYCQGNPLRGEIEAREPGGLQAVTDAVASELAKRFGGSAIEGVITAHVITAVK